VLDLERVAKNYLQCKPALFKHKNFVRFTDGQLDVYKRETKFEIRSLTSAGVYLSFNTTGDTITLDCKILSLTKIIKFLITEQEKGDLKNFFTSFEEVIEEMTEEKSDEGFKFSGLIFDGFDCIVNNKKTFFKRYKSGKNVFKIENPNNELVNVKIYLPIVIPIQINNLKSNGELFYDETEKEKILCLGDSITQGLYSGNPSLNYVNRLADYFNVDALNQGISGYFFDYETLLDFKNLNTDFKFITVAYGTNDWSKLSSINIVRENIYNYFKTLHEILPDTPIFALTPIWRSDMSEVSDCGSFYNIAKAINETTEQYENIHVINGLNLVPHDENYFADLRLHPNSDGFEFMARNLKDEIEKIGVNNKQNPN